jgi:hypothetical protein
VQTQERENYLALHIKVWRVGPIPRNLALAGTEGKIFINLIYCIT